MRPWYALLAALALCTGEAELAASPSFTIANDTFLRDGAPRRSSPDLFITRGPHESSGATGSNACGLLG